MAESNTYVGVVSASEIDHRTTYQTLTSKQAITAGYGWACFTATSFLQAIGVEAMGVASMDSPKAFGLAMAESMRGGQNGRLIRFDEGKTFVSGTVFATCGTTNHVGRLGSFTPSLVEGGDEWRYSWHRIQGSRFVPDVDVQDNGSDKYIDILMQKADELKQVVVRDFSYCVLGSSSAPDTGVMGPSSVYSDLPNLISVTQTTRVVGGIDRAALAGGIYYWRNGLKAIADIGGGGEMDRPLMLRRSMEDGLNDQMKHAEASPHYLLLCSQGAWQYYRRLFYADAVQSGANAAFGLAQKYDAAGIKHMVFDGFPMVWDPNVTVPVGATASTESIYAIHLPTFAISLRKEEAFKQEDWEGPRQHDQQRTFMLQNRTRYTPMVTGRRGHAVFYNMPNCPD